MKEPQQITLFRAHPWADDKLKKAKKKGKMAEKGEREKRPEWPPMISVHFPR